MERHLTQKPEIIDEVTKASQEAANDVGQGEFAGVFWFWIAICGLALLPMLFGSVGKFFQSLF
jgi:hypothetical protein